MRTTIVFFILTALNKLDKTQAQNPPVFSPTEYSITVGISTPVGTTLATVTATDADGQSLTYTVPASNEGEYFAFNSADLYLAYNFDVENGGVPFSFTIEATDDGTPSETGTATVIVSPTTSTTTTTSTPAPPGYDWLSDTYNAITFGVLLGVSSIFVGIGFLLIWRWYKHGKCVPKGCPSHAQCRYSFVIVCLCRKRPESPNYHEIEHLDKVRRDGKSRAVEEVEHDALDDSGKRTNRLGTISGTRVDFDPRKENGRTDDGRDSVRTGSAAPSEVMFSSRDQRSNRKQELPAEMSSDWADQNGLQF